MNRGKYPPDDQDFIASSINSCGRTGLLSRADLAMVKVVASVIMPSRAEISGVAVPAMMSIKWASWLS
jgi:hypothetical protein